MPSSNRFAFVREGVRNHPVIVATSAASIGVLLGAFVAAEIFAPVKTPIDAAPAQQVAVQGKPAPLLETTGSAAPGDRVAADDCDNETWPNLSRACIEQKRAVRVISADRLDKPAVTATEVQPPAAPAAIMPPAAAGPPASTVVATMPAANEPVAAAPAVGLQPSFTPEQPLPAPAAAQTAEVPPQPAATNEVRDKRVAKKAKRKAKPAVEESDDDGDSTVASNVSDDRDTESAPERRSVRSPGKSRRIVERWIERDYDDGASRRVTVNRGGGLFEGLFGIGRGRDDD